MKELHFNIIFSPDGVSEETVSSWTQGETGGLPYWEAQHRGVRISAIPCRSGGRYVRIFNVGDTAVTGFWGVRFPWTFDKSSYTMVPALFYNGNQHQLCHTIPMLKLPEAGVFHSSFCSASYPAVLYKHENVGKSYVVSHQSIAGWNGFELDATRGTLTFYAPAKEPNVYAYRGFRGIARKPYTLEPQSIITIRIDEDEFPCEEITDLYDFYWNNTIRKEYYASKNTPKISEEAGAQLVRDWIYGRHCFFSDKGEPILANAFTEVENPTPRIHDYAEWNTMIGWCSGSMTALPLLYFGEKYRDFAVKYLDFISTQGNSRSGVKYPVYDGNVWMTKDHPQYAKDGYDHLRFYCEYLYYLGICIRYEKKGGHVHPTWESEFERGVEILLDIWEREKDFGLYWDLSGERVRVYRKGSGAGAFALLALGEALLHFREEALVHAFQSACLFYYERCVKSGRCNGGPADIIEADDSESIAALSNALVQCYKIFGGEQNLKMATHACRLFCSWVVNYAPKMPYGTLFENVCVKGGVIANIQNRHIGPGICTNSARFLYDLGKLSGDDRWIALYNDVKAAAINCITTYDGEFYGTSPNEPFMRGMLSEQINMGDSLNIPGETWRVSASWPATAILLGYVDSLMDYGNVSNP